MKKHREIKWSEIARQAIEEVIPIEKQLNRKKIARLKSPERSGKAVKGYPRHGLPLIS